jgi:hypothetical protein
VELGDAIAEAMLARFPLVTPAMAWSLSRLTPTTTTRRALQACFSSHEPTIKQAAAVALLRTDRGSVVGELIDSIESEEWARFAAGAAGDRAAVRPLAALLTARNASPMTLQALAALGDPSVVRSLVDCLSNEAIADSAAWALYWITGAPLFEMTREPETVKEDELFSEELRMWRERREAPARADGEPYGSVVRKPSVDPNLWNSWLHECAAEFTQGLRYRRGQAYSPGAVLDGLLDASTPYGLRSLAYEELRVGFSCPVPFEADWRVSDQRDALRSIGRWVAEEEGKFQRGSWT